MAVSIIPQVPSVSLLFNLEPSFYQIGHPVVPTLSITATLENAAQPITLCTWNTILNIQQALGERRFDIIDTDTDQPIKQIAVKAKRAPITRQLGTSDERYFITLEPSIPHTVRDWFGPSEEAIMEWSRKIVFMMDISSDWSRQPASFGVFGLGPGKYTLRASEVDRTKLGIAWWRYDTKEENLVPADTVGVDTSLGQSEKPTPLVVNAANMRSMNFEVISALQGLVGGGKSFVE